MKKIFLILVMITSLVACDGGYKKSTTYTTDDNGEIHTSVVEKSPLKNMEADIAGKVTFNDDMTQIVGLSPKGYVKYTKGDFKLEAKNDANKKPVIKLFKDGKEVTISDNDAKTSYEEALQEIDQIQSRIK